MKKLFVLLFVLLVACSTPQPEVTEQVVVSELPPAPMPPGDVSPSSERLESAPSSSGQNIAVDIKDFKFSPTELKIKVGDTVTWTQQDKVQHTATSKSGPESFDSGMLKQGESFSFTFTKPGTYEYMCTPHPNMKGTIVVE